GRTWRPSQRRAPRNQIRSHMKSPQSRHTWHYIFEKIPLQTRNINGLRAPEPCSLFKSGMRIDDEKGQAAFGNLVRKPDAAALRRRGPSGNEKATQIGASRDGRAAMAR